MSIGLALENGTEAPATTNEPLSLPTEEPTRPPKNETENYGKNLIVFKNTEITIKTYIESIIWCNCLEV